MSKEQFVDFSKVKEVLEDKGFHAFSCKRGDNGKLTYIYRSISYHCVTITVVIAKLQPNELNSRKIVLNISIGGRNINGWEDFTHTLNNIWRVQREEFPKTFRKAKTYEKSDRGCKDGSGSVKHGAYRNRRDGKNVQVVRKETRKKEQG